MTHSHETGGPVASARPGRGSGQMSRRSVLRGAAGAGAAGLAVSTVASSALASPAMAGPAPDDLAHRDAAAAGEAVVVHVRDVRTGELDVYRGTTHVRVTDRDLAALLARASR